VSSTLYFSKATSRKTTKIFTLLFLVGKADKPSVQQEKTNKKDTKKTEYMPVKEDILR